MIEGNGFQSAEAGPSRPRLTPPSPHQDQTTPTRLRESNPNIDIDISDEDSDELQRESEASALEDLVTVPPPSRPSLPAKASSSLLSRQDSSQRTPKPNALSFISPLHISSELHTSASEIFDASSQTGPRITTYSSLPPSPRGDDYNLPSPPAGQRGVGIKDLNSALHKLNVPSARFDELDRRDEEEDEFWPARSRRETIGEEQRPETDLDNVGRHGHTSDGEIRLSSPEPEEPMSPGYKADGSSKSEVLGIWDLLKDEMGAEEWDGWIVDGKWERIANFLAVPLAMEKTTLFGALLCLDGFLYNFTILPIRAIFAITRIVSRIGQRKSWRPVPIAHLHSILRMLLLFIPTIVLLTATDASKMYHTVRGQDTIKLYVIFNALEIADRLCCAFGQDVLDTLFARETLSPSVRKRGKGRKRQQARPVFFFALSLGYVLTHALIFFYMLVSLNVAINSYDYTLLSLLISNQFVEIKGSVFKKFEKENLFQIMCADIVERFQLGLMLSVIAIRNMIEMAGSEIAFLPKSFIRGKSLVDSILSPVLFVIFSEMMVDWLKHAFITKFNHVRASIYERFTDVLAKDVLLAGSTSSGRSRTKGKNHQVLLDQSPLVARRLGFASIPLACLVIRIAAQALGMLTTSSHHTDDSISDLTASGWAWAAFKWMSWIGVAICAWGCLVFLKVILGLALLGFSAMRQEGMEAREAEDAVNDFGRAPVGESKEETDYNKQTNRYLSQADDDLPAYPSPASHHHTPTSSSYNLPKSAILNNLRQADGGSLSDADKAGSDHNSPRRSVLTDVGARKGDENIETGKEKDEKGGKKKGKKWKLEEVERWTMVKRIW
ncbi:hypothetical protein I317_03661 [Kwoniella heveanensis CBS 569]|nr:hypothetical protein I317_03661 [Kwoniella heveanensis CBS 569]